MHRNRSLAVVGLLALAGLLAALPQPALAGNGERHGGDGHAGKSPKAGTPTQLGFADDPVRVALGSRALEGTADVVRIPVWWDVVRGTGWADIDVAVSGARASGQEVLFTVTGREAPDLGRWTSFLSELRARYPDVWAVQAWNEPNLPAIGGGLSVEQTITIVESAQQALPGVRVIGPGVSPTVPGAGRYQAQLYRALPSSVGVGVNIYAYSRRTGVADVLAAYRKAQADGGTADAYVTELGFHGAYFPNQAGVSAQAFKALRREGATAVVFYRMLPDPTATGNWELSGRFNVLHQDLSPTPILAALRRVAR